MALSTIEKITRISVDSDLLHDVIHGDPTEWVQTDGGRVPTVARALAGIQAFAARGQWQAGTAYSFKDVFTDAGIAYMVLEAHTSTTISADLAAGKIGVYQGVPPSEFTYRLATFVGAISELLGLSRTAYSRIYVTGYYQAGDGVSGLYFKKFEVAPDGWHNGGTQLVAADGAGWGMVVTGPLSVRHFGAKCDGVASDFPFVTNHLAWLKTVGGGTALVPDDAMLTFTAGQKLAIPEACYLSGGHLMEVSEADPTTVLKYGARVILDPTASIVPASSAGVTNLAILKKGIRFDVTSSERAAFFVGTAISIPDNTSGQLIENCAILGFENAVASDTGATNVKRIHVNRLLHDCTNGVYIRNSNDLSVIEEVTGRPFCSFNATPDEHESRLKRDGSNVYLDAVSAYNQVDRCFAYGWANTYRATGSGNGAVTFTDCGADGPGGVADGSLGFEVADSTYEVNINNPRVSGKETGIKIDTQDPNGRVSVVGGHIFESFSNGAVVGLGEAFFTGVLFRNAGNQGDPTGNAVYATNASTKTHITNCSINGFGIGVKTDSNGVKVFIDNNTSFDRCTTTINNPYLPGVESDNLLGIDGDSLFYHVMGNADIYSIAHPERYAGKTLTLKFDTGTTVHKEGGNIVMESDFVTAPGRILRLIGDGEYFYA